MLFLPLFASLMLLPAGSQAAALQFEPGPRLPADFVGASKTQQPGEVRKVGDDVEELRQGERKIFSARRIEGRSCSGGDPETATWVVSAVEPGGKTVLVLITPDGKLRELGRGYFESPLISPDGTLVAYTGAYVGTTGRDEFISSPMRLCDVASGEDILASVGDPARLAEPSSLTPRCWSADSRTLTFCQTFGENEEVLHTLTLQPGSGVSEPLKFSLGASHHPETGAGGEDSASFPCRPPCPGEERRPGGDITELWHDGRRIFSARTIGDRSYSGGDPATGIWVVSAVTGDRTPMSNESRAVFLDGGMFLNASPREIHLILPDGTSRRISLPHTDATCPMISPDGATVAFSSGQIREDGMPGEKKLYLYDVTSSRLTYAAANEAGVPNQGSCACFWSEDSRTLTFCDYQERDGSRSGLPRTLTLLPKK